MSSVLELTGTQRVLLGTLSAHALTMVALNTLKNSVWMYFTGKWFKGKPIRFVGTIASLGLFVAIWKPGRLEAVAVLLLGVAITDGAVLFAEAHQWRSRASQSPPE